MKKRKITVSAGFILMAAALFFFDESGFVLAALPAIAAHEAGHALTLRALGARPRTLHADTSGLSMDYRGRLSVGGELAAAASGPASGLLFALLCSFLGRLLSWEYLSLVAGVSFILSLFNLLPAYPMDGGRILYFALCGLLGPERGMAVTRSFGTAVSAMLLVGGIIAFRQGLGLALIPAGLWLFYFQLTCPCKSGGIVVE